MLNHACTLHHASLTLVTTALLPNVHFVHLKTWLMLGHVEGMCAYRVGTGQCGMGHAVSLYGTTSDTLLGLRHIRLYLASI